MGERERETSRNACAEELQGEHGCLERSGDEPAPDCKDGAAYLAARDCMGARLRGSGGHIERRSVRTASQPGPGEDRCRAKGGAAKSCSSAAGRDWRAC